MKSELFLILFLALNSFVFGSSEGANEETTTENLLTTTGQPPMLPMPIDEITFKKGEKTRGKLFKSIIFDSYI